MIETNLYYEGCDAIERAWREGLDAGPAADRVRMGGSSHRMLSSKAASAEPGPLAHQSHALPESEIMDCLVAHVADRASGVHERQRRSAATETGTRTGLAT
jgi:hypothetical protein